MTVRQKWRGMSAGMTAGREEGEGIWVRGRVCSSSKVDGAQVGPDGSERLERFPLLVNKNPAAR